MFQKVRKFFKSKEKSELNNQNISETYKETIIPFYLNQRIVYDTLAIINDGFTELYNVSNANNNCNNIEGTISAKFDTAGNPLTFMSTSIGGDLKSRNNIKEENKKDFKKVHTPTSLFSKIYEYLKKHGKLKQIKEEKDIGELECGDFVELYTKLSINTTEEMFRKMKKMCNIGEIFTGFGDNSKEIKNSIQIFKDIGRKIDDLIKYLDIQNERIKYLTGQIGEKNIVIKIDKNNIIDADYEQINNGKFKIIGKVLEIVDEEETINLNRESVLGLIKQEGLNPIKEAFKELGNTMFEIPEEIIDEINGKTIIVVPIVIGI